MKIDRITYDDDKEQELDEVLVTNVDSIHIERMDNGSIWMAINQGKERLVVNFWTKRNGMIFGRAEENA